MQNGGRQNGATVNLSKIRGHVSGAVWQGTDPVEEGDKPSECVVTHWNLGQHPAQDSEPFLRPCAVIGLGIQNQIHIFALRAMPSSGVESASDFNKPVQAIAKFFIIMLILLTLDRLSVLLTPNPIIDILLSVILS